MKKQPSQIYQIKVTLDDIHPPVWRRIQVPGNTTLLKLHDILQIVMGWQNSHLHQFTIEEQAYGDPADDEFGDLGTLNEAKFTLSKVIQAKDKKFQYDYDFGDSWEHTLLVEKILSPEEGVNYPLCLKGKRACPPEDVGGSWGYVSFLEAIQDPNHEEHKMYLEWVGGKFDPEAFDLEEINASLRSLKSSKSKETSDPQSFEIPKSEMIKFDKAFSWLETLTDDEKQVAENLPLRRDMVSLLTYLRENKVIGTQSTGNFPLKAVKEITAHFVNPPELEETLGEHVYKVHSESEVWPLFSLHMQASIGGFVSINQGRRWELTQSGERFLEKPAPFQVWFLNLIWWKEANWVVASPFSYQDGFLPDGFSKLVCANLLEIAPNEAVSFETFADGIIKVAGLVWPIRDPDNSRRILHGFVEFAVIKSLADYGILRVDYEPSEKLGGDYRDMVSFQVTAFGKGLLETLQELLS